MRYSESGLMPAGGLPVGMDLMMLIDGQIVPVSQRLDHLDGGVITRIAQRRLAPLVMPMPRYMTAPPGWAGGVDGG